MFQYAAARSLAHRHGSELILDTWSGFVRDSLYRRQFELSRFKLHGRKAHPMERLPIWLYRFSHRRDHCYTDIIEKHWYGKFLLEVPVGNEPYQNTLNRHYVFQNDIKDFVPHGSTWLVGYWQSPRYFSQISKLLYKELMPPQPLDKYKILGNEMQNIESVALGVRLYEESINPGIHAMGGRLKGVDEIQVAIDRMISAHPKVRFYVFCTHRSPQLDLLKLPSNTVYVTHDEGYTGTLETLWLITRCRHHIFTNSSYYWWGAWLSKAVRGVETQKIIAADNFINRDCLCDNWEQF